MTLGFINDCITRCVFPKRYWTILRRNHIKITKCSLKRQAFNDRDSWLSRSESLRQQVLLSSEVLQELSDDEIENLATYIKLIETRECQKKEKKLRKQISMEDIGMEFPKNPERYVHNFSTLSLDKTTLEVLSLGPKFCVPHKGAKQLDLETQFENLYGQLADLEPSSQLNGDKLKSSLVHTCFQYLTNSTTTKPILTKEHLERIKKLKNNKDIIMTRPDKGSGVVILDREDYLNKMNVLLADTTKFSANKGEKDKTSCIEKAICKTLRQLKQNGIISATTLEKIRPVGTHIPRLYGLPKVHKDGVPLRPILDMSNSPYHAMAKWLAELLDPVRREIATFSLRDSFEFVECIASINVTDRQLFSLDVSSLFTNVPLKETIEFIGNYIENSGKNIGVPVEDLKRLLYLCTYNIQFQFNEVRYRQKDGIAMGSPLGPLLADIFMAKLENGILSKYIKDSVLYKRYMDDIICVYDKNKNSSTLLQEFNKAHEKIAFTLETESTDGLSFLDVFLSRRSDGFLRRTIFHKKTWTGQYIHYQSFVPMNQKINLIRCLSNRIMKICSSDAIDNELQRLKSVFLENGYPESFISKNMSTNLNKPMYDTVNKKNVYLSIPFMGDATSDFMNRRISSAIRNAYYAAQPRVLFTWKPVLTLQTKDKLAMDTTSSCVYQFTCSCGASYVGRTSRRLSDRMKEHHPSWLNRGITRTGMTAITTHLIESNHAVNVLESFRPIYKIRGRLSKEVKGRILSTAEAIAIRLYNPPLCAQKQFVRSLNLPWPSLHSPLT